MHMTFASLGTLGDLHPLLALAQAAQVRGHKVVIAASKGFEDYVRSLGFDFYPIRPDLDPASDQVRHLSDAAHGPERLFCEEIFPSVRETYHDLLTACENSDLLLVGELLYVAPLVAAKRGIPWANAALSPSSFLSALDPCVLAPLPQLHRLRCFGTIPHRLVLGMGSLVTSQWAKPLFALRKELGFPPGPNPIYYGKHSPHLTLALFPDFFAPPQRDWPRRVVQTGFPFFEQRFEGPKAAALSSFVSSGTPPLIFTLGSSIVQIAGRFYDIAAAAAEAVGRRAILLLGKNPAPLKLPPSVLGIDYAPLESIFPAASVVIHHGGIGSCAMALRSGVPSLVIPFTFDQPDNAERLRRLSVGLTMTRKSVTVESLASGLRQILDDETMAARARELARRIDPGSELSRTIDALEALGPRP